MSIVEVLNYIRKILGKFEKYTGIITFSGGNSVICLEPNNCLTLYNPSINLIWSSEGYLIEIRITGKDKNSNTRVFRKSLAWSPEGYLQKVSSWEEVL